MTTTIILILIYVALVFIGYGMLVQNDKNEEKIYVRSFDSMGDSSVLNTDYFWEVDNFIKR